MRRRRGPLTLVVLLLLVGCGKASPHAQASPLSSPSPSVATSTEPPAHPAAVLAPLVDKAMIASGGLALLGGPAKATADEAITSPASLPCDFTSSEAGVQVAGHKRSWVGNGFIVYEYVHGLARPDAAKVLAEAANAVTACKDYDRTASNFTVLNLGVAKLPSYPRVAGVFGYCEKVTYISDKTVAFRCAAIITHVSGHLVVTVDAYDTDRTAALNTLTLVGSLAAETVAKVSVPALPA
jgi:hypothetical protein